MHFNFVTIIINYSNLHGWCIAYNAQWKTLSRKAQPDANKTIISKQWARVKRATKQIVITRGYTCFTTHKPERNYHVLWSQDNFPFAIIVAQPLNDENCSVAIIFFHFSPAIFRTILTQQQSVHFPTVTFSAFTHRRAVCPKVHLHCSISDASSPLVNLHKRTHLLWTRTPFYGKCLPRTIPSSWLLFLYRWKTHDCALLGGKQLFL